MSENTNESPRLSVIIAARNEEKHIEQCLLSVINGTLSEEDIEIIVADGGSTDRTRQIVTDLSADHPCVRLIDNTKRTAPTGFNEAIKASVGRAICILGAHCYIKADYLETCLRRLESEDADVVGGPMVTLPGSDSLGARIVMAITSSRFGIGSSFRTVRREGPVDTVVFGVYRRRVFEEVGLFDERLVRNQDNELNSRVRVSGGRVWMTCETESYYYNRQRLSRLVRQNFYNGFYGILTWRINPASFTLRHAVPLFFVLFLLFGIPISLVFPALRYVFLGVLGLYAVLGVAASVQLGVRFKMPLAILFPLAFAALHVSYGVGSLMGIPRFGFRKLTGPAPEKLSAR